MATKFRRLADRLLGRGESAVTLPPMDGALRPNTILEHADVVAPTSAPDNLVHHSGQILCSSGARLLQLNSATGELAPWIEFDAPVAALASLPDGGLAVALVNGQLLRMDGTHTRAITGLGRYRGFCPTALLADGDTGLIVLEGSSEHRCDQWQRDLMLHGCSGSVWRLDLAGGESTCLATGLAWPAGVAREADGSLIISESWRHRLRRIPARPQAGPADVLLTDLPGYPGRLAPAADGGHWLALFAPRSQLVEFVLREKEYRLRMIADIDQRFWVAPSLESGRDFREPLQGGAIKSMGILKPWAPTRSYGLLVRLDAAWQPRFSLHSRADGSRHGITSALEAGEQLLIASKGGHCILGLPRDVTGEA